MNTVKEFKKIKGHTINIENNSICMFLSEKSKDFFKNTVEVVAKSRNCTCNSFLDYPPGNALEYIWKIMIKAHFIIVDISYYSPSVMYELGSALAIRETQDVIIICDNNEKGDKLPFNIGQLNVNFYDKGDAKTLKAFKKKLGADIDEILAKSTHDVPIKSLKARQYTEEAIELIDARKWISAGVLFEQADAIEPNNWKILMEWGRLCRLMNDSTANAQEKLDAALKHVKHPIDKSKIFVEYALYYASKKDQERALAAFSQAEELHNKDPELYLAWIRFHTDNNDLQDAMTKVFDLQKHIDKKHEKANLWFRYLTQRIEKATNLTFEEFVKKMKEPPEIIYEIAGVQKVPYGIKKEDFIKRFEGVKVYGTVSNDSHKDGVFVKISREISGLIGERFLRPGQRNQLRQNSKIAVYVKRAFIHNESGRLRVYLDYIAQ